MTAIIIGFVFIAVGAWGLACWFGDFLVFLKGMMPFSIFVGGVMALIAGISSLQARRRNGKK